jgi:class 3 adenylate cyclase
VQRHHGTVVKTVGDAIMGMFRRPVDAVAAMLETQQQLGELNRRPGRLAELAVRVGIHRGPCLAVTLNERLDYFGTTVNEASRMEAVCDGHELVVSAAVLASPGVRGLCEGHPLEPFAGAFEGLPGVYDCTRIRARWPRPPA